MSDVGVESTGALMELCCWYREYRSTNGAMSEVVGIESTGTLMELCQRLLV